MKHKILLLFRTNNFLDKIYPYKKNANNKIDQIIKYTIYQVTHFPPPVPEVFSSSTESDCCCSHLSFSIFTHTLAPIDIVPPITAPPTGPPNALPHHAPIIPSDIGNVSYASALNAL